MNRKHTGALLDPDTSRAPGHGTTLSQGPPTPGSTLNASGRRPRPPLTAGENGVRTSEASEEAVTGEPKAKKSRQQLSLLLQPQTPRFPFVHNYFEVSVYLFDDANQVKCG